MSFRGTVSAGDQSERPYQSQSLLHQGVNQGIGAKAYHSESPQMLAWKSLARGESLASPDLGILPILA